MPTPDQIAFHYRLEKELANRILAAPPGERSRATLEAYDELFRAVTWHDGHLNTEERRTAVAESYKPFLRIIGADHDVLEIGCGNGMQMRALAPLNRRCVGIDISETVLDSRADMPENVELVVADACDLSRFTGGSFDAAFSSQLVEHLHPEDVQDHFDEVARVLRPGGRYIFETPHRLTGPHDISAHFDEVATCFHLKEYFVGELLDLMRRAGFRRFRSPIFRQSMYERRPRVARIGEIPADWKRPVEALVSRLPRTARRRAARIARLDTIIIVAWR